MSRQRFKVTLRYDSNCGPTAERILYILENNTSDYRYLVNEDGDYVECYGTDSFCDYLSYALKLEEHIEESSNGDWWGCKIEEIGFKDLPKQIKEIYPNC